MKIQPNLTLTVDRISIFVYNDIENTITTYVTVGNNVNT